jgi:hypothetical protein
MKNLLYFTEFPIRFSPLSSCSDLSPPTVSVPSFLQAAGVSVLFSSVIFLDPVYFSVDLFSLPPIIFSLSVLLGADQDWRDFSVGRCPAVVCAALIGPSARSCSRSALLLFCAIFIS